MPGIKKAGGISFGVSMNTSALGKNVKQARGMMGGFVSSTSKQLGALRSQFSGVGAALTAGLSVAGVGGFVTGSIKARDAANDVAKQLGITTESYSRMGYAADLTETSQESLTAGFKKLTDVTRKAKDGLGGAADAYQQLGINAKQLNAMSPDKQFITISDKISTLKTHQEQLNVSQEIFGRQMGAELLPLLKLGAEGFAKMSAESDKFGDTLKSIDAEKASKAVDEWANTKKLAGGVGRQILVDSAPAQGVTKLAQRSLTGLSRMFGGDLGENAAEAKLRGQLDLQKAKHESLLAAANMRAHQKDMRDKLSPAGMAKQSRLDAAKQQGDWLGGKANSALDIGKNLLGTPQQIMDGLMNGAIPQLQRQLAGAQLMGAITPSETSKPIANKTRRRGRQSSPIQDFNAERSGSLAAYQQRVRGAQQFEKTKIPEQQLDTQKKILQALEKSPVVISHMSF